VGRGNLPIVFTADEHPHVCHCAKFERNQTTPSRVIAIQLLGLASHGLISKHYIGPTRFKKYVH